jgi:hypothetical protein
MVLFAQLALALVRTYIAVEMVLFALLVLALVHILLVQVVKQLHTFFVLLL